MGLADLHIHNIFRFGGTASPQDVLQRAVHIGLDVIRITGHDDIDDALPVSISAVTERWI